MVTQDIEQCLWSMLVMRLRTWLTVSICESDSGKISEDSKRHRVVMEETMLLNGRGRQYIEVAMLETVCICVGCHDSKQCRPSKLEDRHGGEVPPRVGCHACIVRFTTPTHATHRDGQLETSWQDVKDQPNQKYRIAYTQAIQHVAAPRG